MTKRKSEFQYYDIRKLLSEYPNAHYYVVFGERSNGKTFSALDMCLQENNKTGAQFAYIRRFGEDIRKKEMTNLFAGHIEAGRLEKIYKHQYAGIDYSAGRFRLFELDENDKVQLTEEPIGFAFDLNSMEHYKSISFPKVKYIVFDEFLSRRGYLPNEFMLFTNVLSTIIRLRNDVKVIMLGNTVNKYCPYFAEMGLNHIKEQKQGSVDVYKYGASGLEVVVEYCKESVSGKKSDVYFAFDNPQLQMITKGSWEIAIYPHLQTKYKPKEVVTQFFIDFDHELLHGEIVAPTNGKPFVFIHRKTTPIQDEDTDIIYGQEPSYKSNVMVGFANQKDKISRFILKCLRESRIFYSTNEVGEIFRNYIMWYSNYSIKNA